MHTHRRIPVVAACLAALFAFTGCSTVGKTNNAVLGGGLALGTFTPGAEIEQIYYLGIIDPIDQVPEAIYRVRVRGQASAMSETKFASGWVPAWAIDTLNTQSSGVDAEKNKWLANGCDKPENCVLSTGRRLVQFGPEGFREAPRNYRLVIVMGADPSQFFGAIDKALGSVAGAKLDQDNAGLRAEFTAALLRLKDDQNTLRQLQLRVLEEGMK